MNETDLVYGVVDDNLVVLPSLFAAELAADYRGFDGVRTYGDARAAVMTHLELPGTSEDELEDNDDGDPYDPSVYDDWPPDIASWAIDVLPEEVGEEHEGLGGAPRLVIDPATKADVVAEIRQLGFSIRRDDDLLSELNR